MSLEINWTQILNDWLDPKQICHILTDHLNKVIPAENAPLANLRVRQFDLRACPAPEIELIDVSEIRDEFLAASGICRSIQSPPPSDSLIDSDAREACESGRIDAASLLYAKPNSSFKEAILQDGIEAILEFSFKSTSMLIEFEADAVLNTPTPAFLALPLKFTLTRLKLDGKLTVALPASLDRVFLAFPVPLNEFDFQIAVDVGDAEKHVLRNVAKIERFLLEQVRIFINDRMILPQFIELPLRNKCI